MTARSLALTVEDNGEQTQLLRTLLDREGYDVFSAATAEAAIAAFPTISPSLAIIDLRLPGVTGEECSRLVRATFPDCRIVISSVLDREDYPLADGALPKPFTGATLHELLAGLTR
ncbi:response regulator [Leucobacter komagatae]|uniref:Response regulatory domain-containing protein n=1 Tax=Leucobacter komagatae TaxID=55969 RepID=A0A0D0HW68_9MICO|nr:response regulator [Leucobacter komagatae]KIP51876.1 hypothetical protein SD72_12620 [Leucobacter komagatae]